MAMHGEDNTCNVPINAKSRLAIRAVAALEIPHDESIGADRLPSAQYPSDQMALVADLQIASGKCRL